MKKLLLVLTSIILTLQGSAQSWSWATSGGGRSNSDGYTAIAKDASGNIYICGDFEGTKSFGSASLTTVGFADAFLAKYNSSGVYQWSVQFSGTTFSSSVEAGGIMVDGSGNVYFCGNFSYTVTAGGNTYTNSGGNNDAIIAKYDPSGNFVWARQLGGNGNERITQARYYNNNIYVTGSYSAAFTVGSVSFAAPTSASDDAFLLKLDINNSPQWGVKGGGTMDDRGLSLDAGPGGIYYGGYFTGNANFGGTNLISGTVQGVYQSDWFIVKLTEAGTQTWAKDFGGNFGEQCMGISQDPFGGVFCIGNFYGSSIFGAGMTLTEYSPGNPAGNGDAFVCKLDASTGTCQWVRHIRCTTGDNNEIGASISCDPGGSAYVIGSFNATTTFGNAANQTGPTLSATANPGKDTYVGKYSTSGTLLWVVKVGGNNIDVGKSILWDANGYCTVAGNFSASITVATGMVITAATASSSYYIARYNGLTAGIAENNDLNVELFPNPASDILHISMPVQILIDRIEIYSLNGAQVKTEKIGLTSGEVNMNIDDLSTGSYMVRLITDQGVASKMIQVK